MFHVEHNQAFSKQDKALLLERGAELNIFEDEEIKKTTEFTRVIHQYLGVSRMKTTNAKKAQ